MHAIAKGNEYKLPCLDAEGETEKCERDILLRQPDFTQGTTKSEPVQQAEQKADQPGIAA